MAAKSANGKNSVKSVTITPQELRERILREIAAGQEIELRSKVDPERTFELTVSTFDENRTLVWEDGGGAFRGVRTFTLTPRGDGTTEFRMAEVFTGSMMGMIEGKLPDFRPSFDAFAADLERAATERAPVAAAPEGSAS